MSEQVVKIESGTISVTGGSIALVNAGGTPISTVLAGGVNSLSVAEGVSSSLTVLNASGNATGPTSSYAVSYKQWTFQYVVTGTLTGTLSLQGTVDNAAWTPLVTDVTISAAGNGIVTVNHSVVSVRGVMSGAAGTGTIVVKAMAA